MSEKQLTPRQQYEHAYRWARIIVNRSDVFSQLTAGDWSIFWHADYFSNQIKRLATSSLTMSFYHHSGISANDAAFQRRVDALVNYSKRTGQTTPRGLSQYGENWDVINVR